MGGCGALTATVTPEGLNGTVSATKRQTGPGRQAPVHQGPHQPRGCPERAEIILGLYKCNYPLAVKEVKLHLAR